MTNQQQLDLEQRAFYVTSFVVNVQVTAEIMLAFRNPNPLRALFYEPFRFYEAFVVLLCLHSRNLSLKLMKCDSFLPLDLSQEQQTRCLFKEINKACV